jgi:hypothetical protein
MRADAAGMALSRPTNSETRSSNRPSIETQCVILKVVPDTGMAHRRHGDGRNSFSFTVDERLVRLTDQHLEKLDVSRSKCHVAFGAMTSCKAVWRM